MEGFQREQNFKDRLYSQVKPMKNQRTIDCKGFTLIELLLVASLLLSIAVCVLSAFSQGVRIFNRLKTGYREESIAFALERITSDLKNSAMFSQAPAKSESNLLSFTALDRSASVETMGNKSLFCAPPVLVTYLFEEDKKRIIRVQQAFPFSKKAFRKEEMIVQGIDGLSFKPGVRTAVLPPKLSVVMDYGDRSKSRTIQKDVLIPISHGK